jgi:hypothetical protein
MLIVMISQQDSYSIIGGISVALSSLMLIKNGVMIVYFISN